MICWWCKGHQSHKLLTKNTSYQGVTFYWVPLHEFSEVLQRCFKPLSHVHWKFTASCAHTVPTTDVQHKIIHKRSSKKKGKFLLIFAEIVENQTLNFWKKFIVPTIGLLLQTHNTMCILHAIVEILENSIWNCRTWFPKKIKIRQRSANSQ
jgi:hypothetical protein